MKPAPFEYHLATSLDEAVSLLSQHGEEAHVLAGGQSLIALMSLRMARPELLVDINGLDELSEIDTGNGVRLGAMVRQRAVERSERIAADAPLLPTAVELIGHAPIRNRGTIGGSLAHGDPAAELPTVLVALDGEVEATSVRGTRRIAAADFYEGFLSTSLEPDEILTAVRFPAFPDRAGWSFQEFSRRSGDFAIAGAAVTLLLDADGAIDDARIALSGVAQMPVRATGAEVTLSGATPSDELWRAAAADAVADLSPPSDLHGSAAYRRHLANVLVRRALQEAHRRVQERT